MRYYSSKNLAFSLDAEFLRHDSLAKTFLDTTFVTKNQGWVELPFWTVPIKVEQEDFWKITKFLALSAKKGAKTNFLKLSGSITFERLWSNNSVYDIKVPNKWTLIKVSY